MNTDSIFYRMLTVGGNLLLKSFDALIACLASDRPVVPSQEIPFDTLMSENRNPIYQEFLSVFNNNRLQGIDSMYKLKSDIGQYSDWKGYPFLVYNYAFSENLKECPITASILKQIPGCTSAMYSVLSPGKHIFPHKGVYKGVIRCLFCLSAPENDLCTIKVNGVEIPFRTGESIYFDETFEHEVVNDSDEYRVVLYLDIYRKFSFPLNVFNSLIFNLLRRSPYISNVLKGYADIEKNTIITSKPAPPICL